ncbi:MAG: VWA domain-containing protein [Acidobacteria bacterium]|nr:VWA domain-containing protein [Acidobacteriota bacterium]
MRYSLILLAVAALAQDRGTFRVGPVYTKNFPDFEMVVEAAPPAGTASTALRAADLTLLEDDTQGGKATSMRRFEETGEGVAVIINIDASGSMRGRPMQAIREGLAGFVGRARDFDKIAVATVANDTRWEATWATPRAELKRRLEAIDVRGTKTLLWDALDESLTLLEHPGLPARRRLVVISDGHDEGSQLSLSAVIEHAARLRIPVDTIGITGAGAEYLQFLESLSRATQGTFRAVSTTEALQESIAGGIQKLLATPVITVSADRLRADGLTHNVGLRWEPNGLADQDRVVLPKSSLSFLPNWLRWWFALPIVGLALLPLVFRRRRTGALPPPMNIPYVPPPAAPVVVPVTPPPPMAPAPKRTQFAASFPAPSPERPAAYLRGVEGPGASWLVAIDRAEFWIGAVANNHCQLGMDETVSGNHASVQFEGGSLRIFDNDSTNKTWVNGEALARGARLLNPGDRVRIGRSTFVLELSGK